MTSTCWSTSTQTLKVTRIGSHVSVESDGTARSRRWWLSHLSGNSLMRGRTMPPLGANPQCFNEPSRVPVYRSFTNSVADTKPGIDETRKRLGLRQSSAAIACPAFGMEKRQRTAAVQDLAEFRRLQHAATVLVKLL